MHIFLQFDLDYDRGGGALSFLVVIDALSGLEDVFPCANTGFESKNHLERWLIVKFPHVDLFRTAPFPKIRGKYGSIALLFQNLGPML